MKFLVALVILAFSEARIIDRQCDGVILHNINHERVHLKDGLDSPYQLAIDYDTNILFFSYTANDGEEVFRSAYINLKTSEFGIIPGVAGGFANAVDSKSHTVYLGGRDGIYKFDFETKTAQHLNNTDHNIWGMFFKDRLYYTTHPDEKAYMYDKEVVTEVPELSQTRARILAVDHDQNILYVNSSGLYHFKKNKGKAFYLGDYNINGFTADIDGNLYFSTPDGIYFIDEKQRKIISLVTIENIYGLAIDENNNIIYAAQDGIIKLKPTKTQCFTDEKKKPFEINMIET